jgi:uncharacterized protein YjiS (DUF1127 family)
VARSSRDGRSVTGDAVLTYPDAKEPFAVPDQGCSCRPGGATVAASLGKGLLVRVVNLSSRTWGVALRTYERWRTVRALSALDNRMLADIGVYRGQIPAIAAAVADGHDARDGAGAEIDTGTASIRPAVERKAA